MGIDFTIVEVGPRDGLQNEKTKVSTKNKLILIEKLTEAGLKFIEAGSFVSPKWVPQMADTEALMKLLPDLPHVRYSALVPNEQGLQQAIACNVKDIAVFAAASETFSQKNINRSIEESLIDFKNIIHRAEHENMRIRGYVSCVLGCPYEGKVPLSQVVKVAEALYNAGCNEISLGDTIGVGTPLAAKQMVLEVAKAVPITQLAVHFHDTFGQALANILSCINEGITIVDSSVAGLGGCPYAKSATGNVATEEVVYMLHGMGIHTGIDLSKLIEAGNFICDVLHQPNRSKVAKEYARVRL
jgi:hydroxymethylglutaryl-CoA lyase